MNSVWCSGPTQALWVTADIVFLAARLGQSVTLKLSSALPLRCNTHLTITVSILMPFSNESTYQCEGMLQRSCMPKERVLQGKYWRKSAELPKSYKMRDRKNLGRMRAKLKLDWKCVGDVYIRHLFIFYLVQKDACIRVLVFPSAWYVTTKW